MCFKGGKQDSAQSKHVLKWLEGCVGHPLRQRSTEKMSR